MPENMNPQKVARMISRLKKEMTAYRKTCASCGYANDIAAVCTKMKGPANDISDPLMRGAMDGRCPLGKG